MKNALDTGIGELSSRYCAARGVNLTVPSRLSSDGNPMGM